VTPTLTVLLPLLKPNDSSDGIRPRQSKVIDFWPVVKTTPVSKLKVRLLMSPDPSQSIVTV
jgi:hypothetical protein